MVATDTGAVTRRLRRIEGQIRGLQRLAQENANCQEFLGQLAAARSALDKVALIVIGQDMKKCLSGEPETDRKIEEALEVFMRHSKHVSK